MKNNLHRFAILIFGIFFIINPTQSQTINLNFEISEATEINTKLSGFNTGPTFNEIFEASPTRISIVDKCAILPAPFNTFNDYKILSFTPQIDLVNKTAEIKPSTMRFPGGTIANFYHLYEYTDGVYDPDAPFFAAGCGTQEIETGVLGGVIRDQYCKKDARVILDDPSANPNYIDGFVNYVLAVEEALHAAGDPTYKMDVLYVPNVFAHFQIKFLATILKDDHLIPSDPSDVVNIADPTAIFELYYKECIDALDYMIDRGVKVVGVEFGNELFFGFYQTASSNVTPETYMALCDIYSQRIALEYPDLKFAVLSEPSSPAWNNPVAAYRPIFYDAVALHDYYNESTCIAAGEPCPDSCPDDYTTDRTCRFDCGKCALGDYTRHEVKAEISGALNVFPDDTKLWFTEWGIISPSGHIGDNLDYMNTFLYSCFVQEHLMQQLIFNANHNNRVEYSTHHRIGYHNRWSIIQTRLGTETSTRQSNFYTNKFFIPLATAAEAHFYNGVSIPALIDSNSVTVNSFIVKEEIDAEPKILIYYSNKTSDPLPMNLAGISTELFDGDMYNVLMDAKTSYLKAADSTGLYSSFGETKFNEIWIDNTEHPSLLIEEDLAIDLSDYVIPALSSGVIKIDLEKFANTGFNRSQSGLVIYPNPSNEHITIEGLKEKNIQQGSIYSISGKVVRVITQQELKSGKLRISELDPGIYLIKINSTENETILKLMKK